MKASRIAFLFGAGVSYAAGAPSTLDITDVVVKGKYKKYLMVENCSDYYLDLYDKHYHGNEIFPPHVEILQRGVNEIRPFIKVLKKLVVENYSPRKLVNYEEIFYLAAQIEDAISDEHDNPALLPIVKRLNRYEDFRELGVGYFSGKSCDYIRGVVKSLLFNIPSTTKKFLDVKKSIQSLAVESLNRFKVVDVFSLNHDRLFEMALSESADLNQNQDGFSIYGFVAHDYGSLRWDQKQFDQDAFSILLYKLHGSVDWFKLYKGAFGPIIIPPSEENSLNSFWSDSRYRDLNYRVFLVGTFNKMLEYSHGIFSDLHCHFRERLYGVNHLIISGYGFADKGINSDILEWFSRNSKNIAIVIHPNPVDLKLTARPGARRWLFPETIEDDCRQMDDMLFGNTNAQITPRPPKSNRNPIIIKKGIERVNWEEIKEHL